MTTGDETGKGKIMFDFPMTRPRAVIQDFLPVVPQVMGDQRGMDCAIPLPLPTEVPV
jgi:hypothetical protein